MDLLLKAFQANPLHSSLISSPLLKAIEYFLFLSIQKSWFESYLETLAFLKAF
jgi:hypothetical protein